MIEQIREGLDDARLKGLYGDGVDTDAQVARYARLGERLDTLHPAPETIHFFSAPGRTELGGNHTDHNRGKVLCAAVHLDTVAAIARTSDNRIILESEGFEDRFEVDLAELDPKESDRGTTTALIRGVAHGLQQRSYATGGFTAAVTSSVAVGSGLSSSASFEVLIGGIINTFYNGNSVPAEVIAQIGQYAENVHFGKPCGLMDQTVCAVGGVLAIDFIDLAEPSIHTIAFDFTDQDYELIVVHTGGGHHDLTHAYAAIPAEMRQAARFLGGEVMREISQDRLMSGLSELRAECGDRAASRALHFLSENRRVDRMVAALEAGDFDAYLDAVAASGASSLGALQNVLPPGGDGHEQQVALALSLSSQFIEDSGRGVCRVHGGGFAGTIQAYIHRDDLADYQKLMEGIFGSGSVTVLRVRNTGVCQVGTMTR